MQSASPDAVAYFSAVAPRFHASYRHDANRIERMAVWKQFFDRFLPGARTAYDLGCGSGLLACELGRRNITTTGVDGAHGMLEIARREAAREGLACVRFERQILPLPDGLAWPAADAVISSSALEYLPSLTAGLRCAHGLLRPGGVLIFSVSNRASLSRKVARTSHAVLGRPRYIGLLKHFCSPEDLARQLAATGFEVLATEYFAGRDRLNRVLRTVLPVPWASNMIIVAARRC